ncbi:hypothetical protein EDB81DRAFT_790157 [Dactylonectria macrodidyma]|uniref:Pentatricopeptide repeat domain-containing protein n=1 Tax=Dactylonectria macrodidyma TaxID=307937 RepID=A0A9P9F534_9HYPO|nr:hypothetical protein EDB81DRAFT_790157 [Dactylonectria macrodidyma]
MTAMHRALRRIRYSSSSPRGPSDSGCLTPTATLVHFSNPPKQPAPLLFSFSFLSFSAGRLFGSGATLQGGTQKPWSVAPPKESSLSPKPLESSKDEGRGQRELHRGGSQDPSTRPTTSGILGQHNAQNAEPDLGPRETSFRQAHQKDMCYSHISEGAWGQFLELREKGDFSSIIEPYADSLRNNILTAALRDSNRMEVLYEVVQHLKNELKFEWPELYTRVLHSYLGQAKYTTAYLWHLRLMPNFTPKTNDFHALLVSFAVNPEQELQFMIMKLYILSSSRRLYDDLIPALFEHGQSQTAKSWRKQLALFGDFPSTSRSRPFLQFCQHYYPLLPLTREELRVVNQNDVAAEGELRDPATRNTKTKESKGIYSDSFAARWFASSWASVEFEINLLHKLGLRTIGPRSLQSLALREETAQEVASRIAQLETLGIGIAPSMYCKALVSFAKGQRQDLLTDLLLCDIHPDEFDDTETRRMLRDAAKRQQDSKRQRLIQEVEWATSGRREKETNNPPPDDLNQILERSLARKALGKARLILDKMESLDVNLSHANAANLLAHIFENLWYFPKKNQQRRFGAGRDPNLDRAIHIIRQVARHDVAIPIRCWRILLYNLGRLGRFDELEELSYQLVELYASAAEGLFPVHQEDLPAKHKSKAAKKTLSNRTDSLDEDLSTSDDDLNGWRHFFPEDFWRKEMGLKHTEVDAADKRPSSNLHSHESKQEATTDVSYYIPTDLPLNFQQHPLAQLFDPSLQRALIRWAYDKKLTLEPNSRALLGVPEARAADFDIAWGVRFLANLRDKGLHIDKQVLKKTIISRSILAQIPGRQRHRARDDRELSLSKLKRLVDDAWGAEILPPLPRFVQEIENRKPKLWDRYSRLMTAAYDPEGDEEQLLAEEAQDRLRQV